MQIKLKYNCEKHKKVKSVTKAKKYNDTMVEKPKLAKNKYATNGTQPSEFENPLRDNISMFAFSLELHDRFLQCSQQSGTIEKNTNK